jgi:enoyl-CoA hydratase
MNESHPLVHVADAGAVRTLTVNRPEQHNALNLPILAELRCAIDDCVATPSVRAIVVTGAGDCAFIAGADITEMVDASPQQAAVFSQAAAAVNDRIVKCPKPVIAAINGYCLGAGLELALACDIRIASTTAVFGLPEIRLGIIPGGGGTVRLARLIGNGPARAMCLSGSNLSAARALELGLVTEMVDFTDLKDAIALSELKSVLNRVEDCDFATAAALECKAFSLCFTVPDQREGMRAFLEKRKPNFG